MKPSFSTSAISLIPNKKWSKRGVEDFQKRLRTMGPLNEYLVVDVRVRCTLLRMLTWYGARRINPRHTAPLVRSHESLEYLKQITGDDFLFCFATNVNEQRIIAFLTDKCCYLHLRSKVYAQDEIDVGHFAAVLLI